MLFNIWRGIKAVFWFTSAWFVYHYYQVVFNKHPEKQPLMNERLMFAAYLVYDSYTSLKDMLTKPPVNSLLLERPPLPPGYVSPKTLVLNVSGTLVHSEYKVSTK